MTWPAPAISASELAISASSHGRSERASPLEKGALVTSPRYYGVVLSPTPPGRRGCLLL